MKVVISKSKFNIVDPPPALDEQLASISSKATVKQAVNGYTITAKPDTLYHILYTLSCKFDIEIV